MLISGKSFSETCDLVISSGLDDLYKRFGALIVDSWDEVTEEVEVSDDLFKVEGYTNTFILI